MSGLWVSSHALALMVMRALVSHPVSGLRMDLGRYRVPRVTVYPVLHHVVSPRSQW
jgi:hypothetical protein